MIQTPSRDFISPIDIIDEMTEFKKLVSSINEPEVIFNPNYRPCNCVTIEVCAHHREAPSLEEVFQANKSFFNGKTQYDGLFRNYYEYHKNESGKWFAAIDTGLPLIQLINERRAANMEIKREAAIRAMESQPQKYAGLSLAYENFKFKPLNSLQKAIIRFKCWFLMQEINPYI